MTETHPDLPPEQQRGADFMRLFLAHERRIYGLILSLIPQWSDADDVMQECTSVLWRKFDEFEPGTNFAAWAFKIARFQVLAFRKRQRRDGAQLSDEIIEQLADRLVASADQADPRRDALENCLQRLNETDRALVQLRYTPGANTKSVASQVARSTDAVYKALNRIHGQLLDCVQLRIAKGAAS